ncbi:MAG: hypothetical protein H7841_18640, partial [Magnetospirillum sp. WYHS-4]
SGTEGVASVVISGLPEGAALSAGTDNGDGTWTLSADQLEGLTVTPPADYNGSFDLTVTATSTDGGISTATLGIDVAAVADVAEITTPEAVSGTGDGPISLAIGTSVTGTEEVASVVISGVPDGATLSAGTDNGDGTWTLSADQLEGLTVNPPAGSSADFQLEVAVTTTDGGVSTATVDVSLAADAETPDLVAGGAAGNEDGAIALDISATPDNGYESIASVTIAGVPEGAALSAGTDNGDGTWTLSADQLDGLTITPPADYSGSFDLQVTAVSQDVDPDTGDVDTATSTTSLTVDVAAVADAADLDVADATGAEDTAIALNISADVAGGEDVASVVIAGVPEGASLSAGTDNGDGTWTLSADQLEG